MCMPFGRADFYFFIIRKFRIFEKLDCFERENCTTNRIVNPICEVFRYSLTNTIIILPCNSQK